MNNEIKEVLDEMKFMQKKKIKFYSLDIYQSKLLLDYITNLENEQISKYQTLKDLQEENERLTAESTEWESKCYELEERIEYLERSNNRREDEIMSLRDECVEGETYKSRNEKAIEYIKKLQANDDMEIWRENGYWAYILHLLGGDDNE